MARDTLSYFEIHVYQPNSSNDSTVNREGSGGILEASYGNCAPSDKNMTQWSKVPSIAIISKVPIFPET